MSNLTRRLVQLERRRTKATAGVSWERVAALLNLVRGRNPADLTPEDRARLDRVAELFELARVRREAV